MRMVRCGDCGRPYDYDDDGFCPHCGTFNQPSQSGEPAVTVRVDGLSEKGHTNSFAHREFHQEEKERRRSGLDKSVKRIVRQPSPPAEPSEDDYAHREPPIWLRYSSASQRPKIEAGWKRITNLIAIIVLVIVAVNLLRSCVYLF